jgi:hypothetical protein
LALRKSTYFKIGGGVVSAAALFVGVGLPETGWITEPVGAWLTILSVVLLIIGVIIVVIGWRIGKHEAVSTKTKKEILDEIPNTLQDMWDRAKEISLKVIRKNRLDNWEGIPLSVMDVVEALDIDPTKMQKAIATP